MNFRGGVVRTGLLVVSLLTVVVLVPIARADTSGAASVALYPNLRELAPRNLKLDRTDVSVDGSGVFDNVLRFSNTVYNAGEGPLILNANIDPVTRSGPALQRVMNSDGSFTDYPAGSMYWHAAHQHYHYDGWGKYELWTKSAYDAWIASGRTSGQASLFGVKTTSCVLDEEFVASLPATPWPPTYYGGCLPVTSGLLSMVLSPGWGDTYSYWRAEQWIDMGQTTLTDGQYVLRSVVDPNNQIYESANKADPSRDGAVDNEAITPFTIQGGAILDTLAPSGTVSINHVDAVTENSIVSVDVLGRDDVSGVDQFRLSNDGVAWATFPYTSGDGTVPTTVSWDLADTRYGGSAVGGNRVVYAQTHDRSGKWSSTFNDSITFLTAPPPPTTGYGGVVAADGPVSYWRLAELSGVAAADSIGLNAGIYSPSGVTLGGASLTTEITNTAAVFDGVKGNVSVPSSPGLSLTGAVSVEAWVRPTVLPAPGSFASVLTKAESYSLQFNGPQLEFTTIVGPTRRRVQAPAGAIVAGHTYHIVGTYDGGMQRLYINGVQVASGAFAGALNANVTPIILGSWNGTSEFLSGAIDEAAVYGKVLIPGQVANHYAKGTGAAPPPPPSQHTLTVSHTGTGSGTVTSAFPIDINCGPTCSSPVNDGTPVALAATPETGSTFVGWSGGGCTGSGACTTTISADTAVTATFSLTPPPPTGYSAAVVGDGPVSYWRLGEASGSVAADSVATNPGAYASGVTLGAASLTSDKSNTAASFNGVKNYVSVPSVAGLSPTSALTLEVWVRPAAKPAAGSFASVVTKTESYSLQFNGPQLEFTTIQGGTRRRVQAPAGAVVAGQAYHVVGTYDGTTQRLFINGVQVASGSFAGAINANTTSLLMGSWNGTSEFLSGTIDDVALYAKVLTPVQIANHYSVGKAA